MATAVETARITSVTPISWITVAEDFSPQHRQGMKQVRKAMHHFAAVGVANEARGTNSFAIRQLIIPLSIVDRTGPISATLEAPQILVDTVGRDIVTWRTNFDEETLVITTEDGNRGRGILVG
ncbi:hypothetical protein QIS74_04888 [Colletotrichum tabaci]|uniref:Uncharacterized protein n=1 Tax=Colletotrichum tabaci TaxID=1209068 RepID=A0AAV9THA1_9PEZI